MEKIISYRSWDGIMFDDEDECREWEWKTTHEPKSICFRDEDFMPYGAESYAEVEMACDAADYIEIANIKGWAEDLDWLGECWGFVHNGIMHPGTYKFDWDKQKWIEVNQPDLMPIGELNENS